MSFFSRRTATPVVPPVDAANLMDPDLPIILRYYTFVSGSLTPWERVVLSGLVKRLEPKTCLEIGTFDGRTTWNIAANAPEDSVIYTFDLPQEHLEKTELSIDELDRPYIDKQESGLQFKGSEYETKIKQLFGDSATFDFSPYHEEMDFIFIDGSHSYEYVKNDSEVALKLRRSEESLLLWHDYNRPKEWPGLIQGIDEMYKVGGSLQ